jgi:hypothetical protein
MQRFQRGDGTSDPADWQAYPEVFSSILRSLPLT